MPVQVERSGVRSVRSAHGAGAGCSSCASWPANADVQIGDSLMTSGIDGIYPPGLPVAKVTASSATADPVRAHRPAPLAGVDRRQRHVLVLEPVGRAAAAAARGGRRAGASQEPGEEGAAQMTAPSVRPFLPQAGAADLEAPTGSSAMIMPRASDQLLLPVNPLFVLATLLAAFLLNLVPLGAGRGDAGLPGAGAAVLDVHQPRRVGVGIAFVVRPADGRAQRRRARPARARLRGARFFAVTVHRRLLWFPLPRRRCRSCRCCSAAQAVSLLVRMIAGGMLPGWELIFAPVVAGAAVAARLRAAARAAAPRARPRREPSAVR